MKLTDICKRLGLPETTESLNEVHDEIVRLVHSKEIFVSMDYGNPQNLNLATVTFRDDPQTYDDQHTVQRLETLIERAQRRLDTSQLRDDQLAGSTEFIKKAISAMNSGGGAGGMFGGSMSLGGMGDEELWEEPDDAQSAFFS